MIKDLGVPVHPVALRAGTRLGREQQRGHPVGEPDGCQGPVRQVVVFNHRVTGREHPVHHHGPLHGHRREGALVLLRVNPFYGHGLQSTSLGLEHEHFLSRSHLAGEHRGHLLRPFGGVVAHEEEVRRGECDRVARLGFDHVEEPRGRGVLVNEHDEVGVHGVPLAVCCQDPVSRLEESDRLLGAVLQGDCGRAREAAAGLRCHGVFCSNKSVLLKYNILLKTFFLNTHLENEDFHHDRSIVDLLLIYYVIIML